MGWLLVLLATAAVAFFVVKTMKAATVKQQAQDRELQRDVLDNASVGAQSPSSDEKPSAGAAISALAGGVGAGGTGNAGSTADTRDGSDSGSSGETGNTGSVSNTGDTAKEIVEMIKILNLAESDAGRLNISREAFVALRQTDAANMPDAATVDAVASRLRKMLA